MQEKKKALLTEGEIRPLLIKLTIPMIFGMLSMVIYNLVDTFFVGQLGKNELAALSFTFPVIMVINSVALGMGRGTSAVISRAVGEGDHHKVQRLATDSLILSVLIVAFFVLIGQLTIEPVFRLLGANENILPIIKVYMRIWYFGVVFVVFPMVGNNIIRALGDSKTPGMVMMIGAIVNAILDPFLIFGLGPFPQLGVAGAALATVFGRMITFIVAIYVLVYREKLILLEKAHIKEIVESWKKILYVGVPFAIIQMITPLGVGVVTSMLAVYGAAAVAGFGVASKIEFFALSFVQALSSIFGPFIGQNWGANKKDRVKEGFKQAEIFSIVMGIATCVILIILAKPIAGLFNKDTNVIQYIVLYIRIVPIAYVMQGIYLISISALNTLNKPMHAAGISFVQIFVLYIPLSHVGSKFLGLTGIYIALASAYIITGLLSHTILKRAITN